MRSTASQRPAGWLQRDFSLPFDLRFAALAIGMALCWLSPNHYMPWLSFDSEFGMCVVVALLAWSVLVARPARWSVPRPALAAAALAAVPLAQFAAGLVYYAGDAWMFSGALLGFALAVAAGATLRREGAASIAGAVLVDAIFAATFCASLVSVGIELWQWLRLQPGSELTGLGLWLMRLPAGMRPFANLAQPNQLSTLLLWGLAGLGWWVARRRVGGAVACLAAGYLLFGLAMTQSRSGWCGLATMAALACVFRRPLGATRRHAVALAALLLGFAAVTAVWSTLNDALYLSAALSIDDRLSAGARLPNWQTALAAVAMRPWFGFGWGQVAVAQQAALLSTPASGEYFAYAHNVVLDLLLWNGVPLGMLIVVAGAVWLARRARRVTTAEGALLLMALAALLVHAMLEYPHAYFYFLLPAGLMVGALDVVAGDSTTPSVPRAVVAAPLAAATVLLVWITHDYVVAAGNMERLRFETANVGTSRHSEAPDLLVLTQLREYLATSRIDVHRRLDAATLARLDRSARRYASDATLFRHAMAAAIGGRPDAATDTLRRLCRLHERDRCAEVLASWRLNAGKHPEMTPVARGVQR